MIERFFSSRQAHRLLLAHTSQTFHISRSRFKHDVTFRASGPPNEQAAEAAFHNALLQQTDGKLDSGRHEVTDDIAERDPKYVELQKKDQRDVQRIHDFDTWNHLRYTTKSYGAKLKNTYKPVDLVRYPPQISDITEELLLASQTHLGHSTSLWHPANSRYIFGVRAGVHIISLETTAAHLRRAAKIVSTVAERGGLILFVGTRARQERIIVRAAELSGACHLFERWIPGSITNGQQLLGRCRTKVVDEFDREMQGFAEQLMDRGVLKPDLVICLNPPENFVLLHECGLQGIPTIGIIDTDQDPTWVTYPIPANDDSLRSVQVIAGVLGRSGEEGLLKRRAAARQGNITFEPAQNLVAPRADRGQLQDHNNDGPEHILSPRQIEKMKAQPEYQQPSLSKAALPMREEDA